MLITLYIIPATRNKPENLKRAIKGWAPFIKDAIVMKDSKYSQCMPDTVWKAFLFSDECLSAGLSDKETMEEYLYSPLFDFYCLYRRALDGKPSEGPRIFKSEILLKDGSVMPESTEGLKWTHILDGWVLEQD